MCVGNARDAGLVTALDRIDGSLLGVGAFDAVLVAPPQPGAPQRLRIFVSRAQLQRVEFVMSDGDIIPCVRVIVGGEEVEVQWNPEEFGRTCVPVETADLSGVAPPAPRW